MTIAIFGVCLLAAGNASAFDPAECARIHDVDVPYEVDADDAVLTFKGEVTIIVTPAFVEIGQFRFDDATVSGELYTGLTTFLNAAAAMAHAGAEFGIDWSNIGKIFSSGEAPESDAFLGSVTAMCKAIIELDVTQSAVAESFADFVTPVEIDLR